MWGLLGDTTETLIRSYTVEQSQYYMSEREAGSFGGIPDTLKLQNHQNPPD